MHLIDTHCHLYMLDSPIGEVIERAKEKHVNRMICIGAGQGLSSATTAVDIATTNGGVWATVGIHPHDAKLRENLSSLEALASNPKVVAIGETGLDFYRDWAPKDDQLSLFKDTIALAKNISKPLVIHCRQAEEETFVVLDECKARDVGGVFHCFPGTAEFAKRLSDINFSVSLTGIITFKNAEKLRSEIKKIPIEQILLETDAPYLAPEPFRGKQCEPMHVYYIASVLAEVKGTSIEEVSKITTSNAERLFGLA